MEAAEASGILKIVGNKLAPLLMKEYSSIVGVKKYLQELYDQVVEINCWLESVGDKAVGSDPSFDWIKQLKDIAYEVDGIVDEFQLMAEKHETTGDGGIVSKCLWNKPKSIVSQCKVPTKIKAMKKKFAAVVKQISDFRTIANSLQDEKNMTVGEMPSLPSIDVSVLGRDKEKHELISKLVEVKDQQMINIVSIIGLGGLGKTTLAKLVYNDANIIDNHFDVKLWVHVSQEFDVAKLVGKLFEAITGENSEQYPLQYMSKKISDNLSWKRYLLVLDDVWTKDQFLWDHFMVHLKSGAPGSSILLTMRSSEVAGTVRSTYQFSLTLLSLDDSWQLFQQSLGMSVKHWESEFEEVGKEIVNKYGGVPLAIKVIAGALRGKEFIQEWQAMRDNNLVDVVKQTNDFSTIRNSLAVGHLVPHMNNTTGEMPLLPNIDAACVLGRDKEKHELISKLVEVKDQQMINIVSIIGLGGSGKTTLAKLVFNDANIIDNHFDVKLWVHVSQEFDVAKLVGKLFEAIADEKSEQYPLQQMSKIISDKLTGKRYLLVLDDVWTKNQFLWDQFMMHLKSGTPESAILLTMRSSEVAGTLRSTHQFSLPFLSLGDSWQLFQQSLGMPVKHLESEFVKVGEEIVNKCGGVPLAIKVIARALRGKELIEEWQAMRDSNFLDVEDEEASVSLSACLRLSYSHLPSHIRQCFRICSIFPKGYMIDKEKLIDLWIAHDMIIPETGVEYLEDVGHKCFNSLLQVSFLQIMRKEYERVTYTMPDLIHDLARSIMGEEISLTVPEVATSSTKSFRYFSITEWPLNLPPDNIFEEARAVYVAKGEHFKFGRAFQNVKHLHSITVEYTESIPTTMFRATNLRYLEISGLKCDALPEAISDIWSLQALHVTYCDILNLPKSIGNLQKLRTLNLSWCKRLKSLPGSVSNCRMISNMDLSGCIEFEVLPDSIGTNKRLKVLRTSHTKIKRLPPSIVLLEYLECLDLQWCCQLVELPEGIENLKKLEVLNLKGCNKLRMMPTGIGKLNRIKILSTFVVAEDEKSARISALGNIRITGGLSIRGIACVMDPDDARNACLKEKTNLQSLQLHWGRNDADNEKNVEAIFDALHPPPGIKELYIVEYAGRQCPQWMLNYVDGGVQGLPQFSCLTVMVLCGFQNLKKLGGLMELPCLEELKLQWMPLLTRISGGPFPSLVKLRLEGLRSLGEVWMADGTLADGDGRIKIGERLSDVHIEECPKLMLKWCFPSPIEHLVLKRSNDQLLLLPRQGHGEGPSSSSSSPTSCSFSQLKDLELWGMAASSSSQPATPGSGSKHAWELLQHMTALESLKICQRSGLTELPDSMRSLTSLRSLFINFCSAICMLPEWLGELHSLQQMTIQSCHSLSGLPQSIDHLTSLQELRIERCDELHQLPECLGGLRCLRKLYIASLQGLNCLPMSMCRSLEELEISDCPGLTSLPEWIQGLRNLQKLKITGCPDLERRCEREKGEDWHLIEHIYRLRKNIQIGLDEGGPAC